MKSSQQIAIEKMDRDELELAKQLNSANSYLPKPMKLMTVITERSVEQTIIGEDSISPAEINNSYS